MMQSTIEILVNKTSRNIEEVTPRATRKNIDI